MPSNTPWAFYDPDGSCLRTSAPSLLDDLGWMSSSLDLPASGSMLSGRVYERPTLALRTVGSGGSCLPTPEASDGTGGRVSSEMGGTRPSGAKRSVTLATAVHHALLPTPRSSDGPKGGPGQVNGRGIADSLPAVGALLPTPCAQEPGGTVEDYHARLAKADGRESTFVPLGMVAQLLPTPRATRGGSSTEMQYELGATTAPPSPDGSTPSDDPHRPQPTLEDD